MQDSRTVQPERIKAEGEAQTFLVLFSQGVGGKITLSTDQSRALTC